MSDMFDGVTLSVENYDMLLNGWSTLGNNEDLQSSVTFGAGNSQYCAAIARTILASTYDWNIDDRGFAGSNCPREPAGFITTWVTTGNDESITIPTAGVDYDYSVNWGDGDIISGYNQNAVHTYINAGTYTVTIIGDFPRIYFNNSGDNKDKIFSIEQWGTNTWSSMNNAFEGCTNLHYNADDNPDLSEVTSMISMFKGASVFDGNIGAWNVSNVENMGEMFSNVTLSTTNYDALLVGWSTIIEGEESPLSSGVNFDGGNSQFCNTLARTMLLNSPNNWEIDDGGFADNCPYDPDPAAFITTWVTTGNDESITIPTITGTGDYNYLVNWGDGSITGPHAESASHTYTTGGSYNVAITGDFPHIYFDNRGDKDKIFSIDQWGDISWSSMDSAFEGCTNLRYNATDNPDLSQVAIMVEMFKDATAFNGNIGSWHTVRVEQMRDMFNGAAVFNQDISNWNVMNVVDMSYMFNRAETFNQDIGNWNVMNVQLMRNMFSGAEAFDQDIGNWNVSNVRGMINMFDNVTLSTFNYDALLVGWSTIIEGEESPLVSRVSFNGGNSQYCNTLARTILTSSPNLWTITDGGQDDDIACNVPYVANEIPDQDTTLGTGFRYTILEDAFEDPNNDTLVYAAEIIPSTSWLSFTTSTLTFSGTPTNITDIGIITITVSVSDELGNGTNDIFTVTVLNRPPILEENRLETQIAVVGEPFEYRIPPDTFSDADIDFRDILTYTVTIPMEVVDWLSFTTSTLTFSGIPTEASYPNVITISITATDLNNDSATGTFVLAVQTQRDANQCFPKSRRRITGPLSEN